MELYNEELPALIDPDDDVVFQSNSNDSFNSQDTVKATSKSEIQIDNEDFKSLVHSQIEKVLEDISGSSCTTDS